MAPEAINHFIGGRYVRSSYLKTFPVADPATGECYAQIAVGRAADINQAVLAAQAALKAEPWAGLEPAERASLLTAIAEAIGARADEIAAIEAQAVGLPVTQARELAAQAAEHFHLAASAVPGQSGSVLCRPAGVAGVITSWRAPFLAQARAIAPALAAGCPVVLNADACAPLPAMLLAEITTGAGLPDGVLNVVHGTGDWQGSGSASTEARDALVEHPAVPVVSLAGEIAQGEEVSDGAAAHGKSLRAELAGVAPCFIFADADLDQAVDSVLFGAFWLNGQRRTASSRVLVQRPVYDDVVSRLADRAGRIRVGAPLEPRTQVGPLVDAGRREHVMSWVRQGIAGGARLVSGGKPPADLAEGNYLAPTVLADVAPWAQVFGQQACGPVLCVTPFETADHAVTIAAAMRDVLAAYVWTADLPLVHRLAWAVAGSTWVNSHNARDLTTPPGEPTPDIGFYTQTRAVHIAADVTPVPRFVRSPHAGTA